jgi:hypothetical protein
MLPSIASAFPNEGDPLVALVENAVEMPDEQEVEPLV